MRKFFFVSETLFGKLPFTFFLVVAHKLLEAHVVKRLDQKYVTALAKYVYLPLPWHNGNTKFSVIGKILDQRLVEGDKRALGS